MGEIVGIDDDDKEVEITFMERKNKDLYRWINKSDELCVPTYKIICKIDEHVPTRKPRKHAKISSEKQSQKHVMGKLWNIDWWVWFYSFNFLHYFVKGFVMINHSTVLSGTEITNLFIDSIKASFSYSWNVLLSFSHLL